MATTAPRIKKLTLLFQFGLCSPNISNPNSENSLECNSVLEATEYHFQSWTFWDTCNGFEFWNEVKSERLSPGILFMLQFLALPHKIIFTGIFEP